MARFTATRFQASTLESLPPARRGLPARAGHATQSSAASPESLANFAATGCDAGYVRQYGVIRVGQTESSAAGARLSAQRGASCLHNAGAALSAQAVPV